MLNLYMNNRGATKGKRGEDKSCLSLSRKKQVIFLEFSNLTLLMADVTTKYLTVTSKAIGRQLYQRVYHFAFLNWKIMVLIYKSDKKEIYQWYTRVWKIFLSTKLVIQNKATVVVVRGPAAALMWCRNVFFSVFSYAEQFIGATFDWTWKIKNSQLS